jgi:hypothetical protein
MDTLISSLDNDIVCYKKEKKEILLGSATIGKENWAQDIYGELGKVIGVKEWEVEIEKLGEAGNSFDGANLILQLCLVMGAICLITPTEGSKKKFFYAMVLGVLGSAVSGYAYWLAV